jgi:hypothetical protein
MPVKGYPWKDNPILNIIIIENYNDVDLDFAKSKLIQNFHMIRNVFRLHSNKELFKKKSAN